jgi:hypothetical protein
MTEPNHPPRSPKLLTNIGGSLRALLGGVVKHFVWHELHEGMIGFRGLERNARVVAWFGVLMLLATVAAIVCGDSWRATADLILLSVSETRGQLAPAMLFPVTLFLLVVAWTLALAGALHANVWVRFGVLGLYLLNSCGWVNSILGDLATSPFVFYGALASLAGVVICYVVRGPAKSRPAAEFSVLFALVSVVYLLTQQHGLERMHRFGIPVQIASIQFNLSYLGGLITPLMVFIGVDIAEFARHASHWTTETLVERSPRKLVSLVLIAMFAWRLYIAALECREAIFETSVAEQWWAHLGALGEIALVGGVYWLVARTVRNWAEFSPERIVSTSLRIAFSLVVASQFVSLLIFLVLSAAHAIPSSQRNHDTILQLLQFEHVLSSRIIVPWHYAVVFAACLCAIYALRRGWSELAVYLGAFGTLGLWEMLTRTDGWLNRLTWRGESPVDIWWLALFTIVACYRLVRRQLTFEHQSGLIFLLLLLTLMRQRDFIENPFTPILGFAGASFIAFGLVWDLATHGQWAKGDSIGLPRASRVYLYLGYVLLAAIVLNWAVATHDLDGMQKLTGGASLLGFDRFGKPMLYIVFFMTLFPHAHALESPQVKSV